MVWGSPVAWPAKAARTSDWKSSTPPMFWAAAAGATALPSVTSGGSCWAAADRFARLRPSQLSDGTGTEGVVLRSGGGGEDEEGGEAEAEHGYRVFSWYSRYLGAAKDVAGEAKRKASPAGRRGRCKCGPGKRSRLIMRRKMGEVKGWKWRGAIGSICRPPRPGTEAAAHRNPRHSCLLHWLDE